MPVMIALVLLPIQVALWWHAQQVADAAAQEAVDAAQVINATARDGIHAAEWLLDTAGNLAAPQVSVVRTSDTVTAEVTGRAPRLLPGLQWQVAAKASGPVERFIPEPDR